MSDIRRDVAHAQAHVSKAEADAPQVEADSDQAKEYRVGYRRPPLETRFCAGVSGNPRGRPKGARSLASVVATTLGERVAVTENGRRRRITKLEAAVKQLVNRAASGEARAMQLLLALVQASEARPLQPDANRPTEGDEIVLRELKRRLEHGAA
jgi:hypothetical protein